MKTWLKLNSKDARSLTKRYLFWLYKTTKDELDKIDRKFTQLVVDRQMLAIFERGGHGQDGAVDEWRRYIATKEADARKIKFVSDGVLQPAYAFLRLKMSAILEVTRRHLGIRAIREFERLSDDAAMRNILNDASGRR